MECITNATKKEFSEVIEKAVYAANSSTPKGPGMGCGRIYVVFSGKTLTRNSKVVKGLQNAGFRMMPSQDIRGIHLYIGYDNNTGREMAAGEAVAEAFRSSGFSAYVSCEGD